MKEETTKKIKKIEELKDKKEEDTEILEEEEEILEEEEELEEEPQEEEKEEPVEEKSKLDKKKIIMISSIAGAVLLILIILILCIVFKKEKKPEPKKVTNDGSFVSILNQSLESGAFDKEINRGLKENGIQTKKVKVLYLDIDSDEMQEIVVYAEENKKAVLLSLEVEEDIVYDEFYPIDGKDALGYGYSSERGETLWYILYNGNVVIISDTKKIIKAEDYIENYVGLAYKYKGKVIVENGLDYKFDQKLDAEKLEKEALTGEIVLKDNNIKIEDAKSIYDQYIIDKAEKEKKEQEEAEKKAREEEEARKTKGTLQIGKYAYKYGNYKLYNADNEEVGDVSLYSDLTCVYKGQACTYTIGDVRDASDSLVPGLALSTGQHFITTVDEGIMIEPKTSNLLKYVG